MLPSPFRFSVSCPQLLASSFQCRDTARLQLPSSCFAVLLESLQAVRQSILRAHLICFPNSQILIICICKWGLLRPAIVDVATTNKKTRKHPTPGPLRSQSRKNCCQLQGAAVSSSEEGLPVLPLPFLSVPAPAKEGCLTSKLQGPHLV